MTTETLISEVKDPLEDNDIQQIIRLNRSGFSSKAIAQLLRLDRWVVETIISFNDYS